ncbi:hypothetical protein [uncultured Enterococcus sp.]|uniref:hypothetical protein n=1 Tax=uncultured Enterococcus sp. TaxID=167972 RepID=UPI0025899316|nr:hypothetical protein [uncultured Enterococcus sp.]
MTTNHCKKCGKEIIKNQKLCDNCRKTRQEKTRKTLLGAGTALLSGIAIGTNFLKRKL